MTTTAVTPKLTSPGRQERYSVMVQRARGLLQFLLVGLVLMGILTTVVSFLAVQDALERYRKIVADSAVSADAAQGARSALLAHHSEAADYLSQQGTDAAAQSLDESRRSWRLYQEEVRNLWQNRSDRLYGEYAVFEAADQATLRYKADIDAMVAFVAVGEVERAKTAFLESHQTLVQEVIPALNGLESVKLESMEESYATTSAALTNWQQALMVVGGLMVLLLLLALGVTRFWMHYGWTWELAVASVLGIVLFAWLNFTLFFAAQDVKVLVRDAYDTISGIQAVEALLTQTDAMENMAIFDRGQATGFLRDADQYLFLLEQQLCGELACTDTPFNNGGSMRSDVIETAQRGQSKYSLPRTPLVANATFEGEAQALEELRGAIQRFRQANDRLGQDLSAGNASEEYRTASEGAYKAAREAARKERGIVRDRFETIHENVTTTMEINRWLAFAFTALSLLGFWGLRRRREALFP
ncbi:MAG: hypothetical protein H0T73_00315 [Ardenticatenales bacterium]|nr:hypothetical protein [Ardenticatenales bacterium]